MRRLLRLLGLKALLALVAFIAGAWHPSGGPAATSPASSPAATSGGAVTVLPPVAAPPAPSGPVSSCATGSPDGRVWMASCVQGGRMVLVGSGHRSHAAAVAAIGAYRRAQP